MGLEDLRKLLKETDNRYGILSDLETLIPYNINIGNLEELIGEFLTDEEKVNILKEDIIKGFKPNVKREVIKRIKNDEIKLKLFNDKDAMSGLKDYDVIEIIETLENDKKLQWLKTIGQDYQGPQISENDLYKIINELDSDNKKTLLQDSKFTKDTLKIQDFEIINLICEIEGDKDKLELGKLYQIDNSSMYNIVSSLSSEAKKKIILENPYNFTDYNIKRLINTLDAKTLADIFKNNKEFLRSKEIKPYEVIRTLSTENQLDFISIIENTDLSLEEKRKIFVFLNTETKQRIDKSNLPHEYKTAIEIQVEEDTSNFDTFGKIIIDLNKDPEIYRGLDELITINALTIKEDDKEKFLKLCEICPKLKIIDDLGMGISTIEEYKNSEKWIETILQEVNPKWNDIEKIAFIDNAIGKKISYTPDFRTEVCDEGNARALWKIIDSGYGVCNGIAQIEQYMLGKLGIESERVSSSSHCFLRLKNIKLPTKDGNVVVGDTLLDPTWNLSDNRFSAMPQNFCISYDDIRKHDMRADGIDSGSHKNESLEDVTLSLDQKAIRSAFKTVGLTDKDGNFPIKTLIEKSQEIDEESPIEEEQIKKQLMLLKEYYPNFAMCENSSMSLLESMFVGLKNTSFDKCIVNRVYDKNDEEKRPVVYVYANFPNSGKKFYYIDKNQGEFISIEEQEFSKKFECYEQDLTAWKGKRPWEDINFEKEEDLSRSSGKIVADEGEER